MFRSHPIGDTDRMLGLASAQYLEEKADGRLDTMESFRPRLERSAV